MRWNESRPPNDEVIVACDSVAYRLDVSGATIQTYPVGNYVLGSFFALALDPDDATFWIADLFDRTILQIDIDTGSVVGSFDAPVDQVGGLAVFGKTELSWPLREDEGQWNTSSGYGSDRGMGTGECGKHAPTFGA